MTLRSSVLRIYLGKLKYWDSRGYPGYPSNDPTVIVDRCHKKCFCLLNKL